MSDHIRPPRTLLVFGTGDSGEFGLGDDERGEIARPRLHAWVEEAIEDGKFGAEPGAGLEAIAVGGMHSLAIDEKGRVWTWGVNDAGALGRRTDKVPNPNKPDEHLDRDVLESTPGIITALEKEAFRAVRVAGGDSVSIAISDDGRVRYWGSFRGNEGLLGFGGVKKAIQFDPVELPLHAYGSKSSTFVSVAAGSDHVLALASDGVVYAMGDCMKAQLGRRVGPRHVLKGLIPEQLALRKIEKIATGSWHSFAIDTEGRVYAWGFNGAGQCGVPSRTDDIVDRPTVIPSLLPSEHNGAKVVAIDAGSHHSLFLFSDGSLWGCGKIVEGEVGLSQDHPAMTAEAKEEQCITEPVQIFFPPTPTEDDKNPDMKPYEDSEAYRKASSKIVDIACGERFSLALTTDGHAYSWGLGVSMQLGLGNDTETAPTPTLIRGKVVSQRRDPTHSGFVKLMEIACVTASSSSTTTSLSRSLPAPGIVSLQLKRNRRDMSRSSLMRCEQPAQEMRK